MHWGLEYGVHSLHSPKDNRLHTCAVRLPADNCGLTDGRGHVGRSDRLQTASSIQGVCGPLRYTVYAAPRRSASQQALRRYSENWPYSVRDEVDRRTGALESLKCALPRLD